MKPIGEQLRLIDQWVRQAEKAVRNDSGGCLVIAQRRTKTEWYVKRNKQDMQYLSKKNEKLARTMAQATISAVSFSALLSRRPIPSTCSLLKR